MVTDVKGLDLIMYDAKDKKFRCDNCGKIIEVGELCWVKWQFPPSHLRSQTMPTKVFEYDNSPILCSICSKKDLNISQF